MEKSIRSVDDAENFSKSVCSDHGEHLFRGHSHSFWRLTPWIGRETKTVVNNEERIFWEWTDGLKEKGYIDQLPTPNDFRLLALAQLYGVFPTRLLDWSRDILIALFFACKGGQSDADGCIWLFPVPSDNDIRVNELTEGNNSPFAYNKLKLFICSPLIDDIKPIWDKGERILGKLGKKRAWAQKSCMTIHPKGANGTFGDFQDLRDAYGLVKIEVPKECKQQIIDDLSMRLVCEETVFQGESPNNLQSKRDIHRILIEGSGKIKSKNATENTAGTVEGDKKRENR